MSYKVTKLVVAKGRTVSHEKDSEWIRERYELEITIPDERELSIARENALHLLDDWLGIGANAPMGKTSFSWNPQAIKWTEAQGSKGPYQRSEDVNNLEFKALLKDLASHNGKLTRDGWFFWTFQNGHTIGRKKRK